MNIKLTEFEQEVIENITKERLVQNIREGRKDLKMSSKNGYDIALDGYGAEFACCKHLLCMFDFTTQITNPGYDFKYLNHTIDCKNIDKSFEGIMTYEGKNNYYCDYYILTNGTLKEGYDLIGYCSHAEFINEDNLSDKYGKGMTYFLDKKKLHKDIKNIGDKIAEMLE